jgi:hypothetical protein
MFIETQGIASALHRIGGLSERHRGAYSRKQFGVRRLVAAFSYPLLHWS